MALGLCIGEFGALVDRVVCLLHATFYRNQRTHLRCLLIELPNRCTNSLSPTLHRLCVCDTSRQKLSMRTIPYARLLMLYYYLFQGWYACLTALYLANTLQQIPVLHLQLSQLYLYFGNLFLAQFSFPENFGLCSSHLLPIGYLTFQVSILRFQLLNHLL